MTEPWRISEQERELVRRVLTVVLREDVGGLRSRGELVAPVVGEHWWLRLNRLRVPVEPADPERGDLLTDLAVRAPMVVHGRHVGRTSEVGRLDGVLAVLAQELPVGLADDAAAELRAGLVDLRAEADAALAAAELRAQRRPAVLERIAEVLGPGWAGAIGYEWLAAHRDHPFYPASLARVGLPTADLPRFAPEHAPTLDLRWVSLPADGFSVAGGLPDWWPSVPEGRIAIPVHPAQPLGTAQPLGRRADVSELGLMAAHPTLSLRTVQPLEHPGEHLKLPLAVSTLGTLNVRRLTRASLADGALVSNLLREVVAGDPDLADRVVVADESTWVHSGSDLLAVMVRRWPDFADMAGTTIVPLAGLTARTAGGALVLDGLASLDDVVRLSVDVHVTLWLRHGIVLEAHPQNVLLAVGADGGLRLLIRDLDSAKVDPELQPSLSTLAVSDPRLLAGDPGELADLFTTTTLHQAIAATVVETALATGTPVAKALGTVRDTLAAALDRHRDTRDAGRLRALLEAPRLPVKRALTAATLLPKTRTGAADVNKFYGADGPSYLR